MSVLALMESVARSAERSLSEAKRTCSAQCEFSHFDPKRSSTRFKGR